MKIDVKGLRRFLETLQYKDFQDNKKIKEAHTIDVIEHFNIPISNDCEVIKYGEPFLVDLLGNDLTIAILTKKPHKTTTGRVVNVIQKETVIKDCRFLYGSCLNGYWAIPKEFITVEEINDKEKYDH